MDPTGRHLSKKICRRNSGGGAKFQSRIDSYRGSVVWADRVGDLSGTPNSRDGLVSTRIELGGSGWESFGQEPTLGMVSHLLVSNWADRLGKVSGKGPFSRWTGRCSIGHAPCPHVHRRFSEKRRILLGRAPLTRRFSKHFKLDKLDGPFESFFMAGRFF